MIGLAVAVSLLLASVIPTLSTARSSDPPLTVLRIGVLPDQEPAVLKARYAPLIAHLERVTGLPVEMQTPANYSQIVEMFGEGKIDLGYFGGLVFVLAQVHHGAEPLITRDVDTRFTSYFIARTGTFGRTISDFEGKSFGFGSRLSASAHLMPRHFLVTHRSITPETYFRKVRYTGAHDASVYGVLDGTVDLAVSNSEVVRAMLRDGRIPPDSIRILRETPPYTNYVWAVRRTMDDALKTRLRDAFLVLTPGVEAHDDILGRMGANSFLPADPVDFEPLKRIASDLGLLGASQP